MPSGARGDEAASDPLAPHRLGIGRLLGETLDHLEADAAAWAAAATAAEGGDGAAASSSALPPHRPAARLRLLSGHDTTIVPILAALGCYDGRWPPYASYVAVELWANSADGALQVRVVFNGQPLTDMRGCKAEDETGCVPFQAFAPLVRSLTPTNLIAECQPMR